MIIARAHPTNPVELAHLWTVVDGRRIHARVAPGPADSTLPPVVLVHGLSVSSRYLLPTARALAAHTTVYAPDLPGHGYSDHALPVLDIPGLADALAAWCRAVGLERAVFLGNSLGCQTIANLALRHPELVEAAIFSGPAMNPGANSWRMAYDLAKDLLIVEELPLAAVILLEFAYAGPWCALRTYHFALNDRALEKYSQIRVPVLVMRGERDPIIPAAWAEQVAGAIPHARPLITVPGTGHCLHYHAPDKLVEIVLPFLGELAESRVPAMEAARAVG
jgi:2-hydroxy-6-oxonona-2,4-dienedioate hydrolase